MAKIDRYLGPHEDPALVTRRHPWVLAAAVVIAAGGLAAAFFLGLLLDPSRGETVFDAIAAVIAAWIAIAFAWRLLAWRREQIVLTDERIVIVSGIVRRSVTSTPLGVIGNVVYRRGLMGRLVGFGDFLVEAPGGRDPQLDHIPQPDLFYRTLSDLLAGRRAPAAPLVASWAATEDDDTGPIPTLPGG